MQERWLTCHYSTANTDRVRAWIDGDSIVVFGVDTPVVLSDSGRWTVTRHARTLLTAIALASPPGLMCLAWLLMG